MRAGELQTHSVTIASSSMRTRGATSAQRDNCIVVTANAGTQWLTVRCPSFCVYMLASRRNGTIYIGVTSNLAQRAWQHNEGFVEGFTKRHDVKVLVRYEQHESAESAIIREKQLNRWNRSWKIQLIESRNPYWNDLFLEIVR